ncbi:MAG: hypothetical protein EXR74_07620 [Bdellovibrionales bacterium]|nr:hypothetical protein [Bdellovibrionales bacterium]
MIDEEKTKELVTPTTGDKTKDTESSPKTSSHGITRKWEQTTTTRAHPIATIVIEPSWLTIIQTEIREDASLRILAAIAILVLSLLVF